MASCCSTVRTTSNPQKSCICSSLRLTRSTSQCSSIFHLRLLLRAETGNDGWMRKDSIREPTQAREGKVVHMSVDNSNHTVPIHLDDDAEKEVVQPSTIAEEKADTPGVQEESPANKRIQDFATRANLSGKEGIDRKKLVLLVLGLVAAVLFFLVTQFQSKPVTKPQAVEQKKQQDDNTASSQQQKSKTPIMDPVTPKEEQEAGRLNASDIARTKKPDYATSQNEKPPHIPNAGSGKSVGDVPSFSDTQQKWENPQPHNSQPASAATAQMQETNALKEASLVFVRTPDPGSNSREDAGEHLPVLQLQEGTRIEARLETQISSDLHAPVVAVVENTYAVGDTVLVPAGARIFGKLSQADTQGNVGVDFTEIDLLDGSRETIEAIGTSTDRGPIKGNVYGKRNGRNFLIRALSGLGSTAMMVVGNNVNGAYSEGDMIRERAADNLGMATDSQLMQLNGGTHVSVSVPANTRIYVVWTQHQKGPDASATAKVTTAP
jgi:type IV secretory pathway VirB10-like protein